MARGRICCNCTALHGLCPTLEPPASATQGDLAKHLKTIPAGVNPRQGTSAIFSPQIPDLIGLRERLYFDHTGLQQHRSVVDLMRYDAVNNFIEEITTYGDFVPSTMTGNLPDPAKLSRASDMELYALALYLYSLSLPPNSAIDESRGPQMRRRLSGPVFAASCSRSCRGGCQGPRRISHVPAAGPEPMAGERQLIPCRGARGADPL
jgi:hypothetical protein